MKFLMALCFALPLFAQNMDDEKPLQGYLGGGLELGYPLEEMTLFLRFEGVSRVNSWLMTGLSYQTGLNKIKYVEKAESSSLVSISVIDLVLSFPVLEERWGGVLFPFHVGYGTLTAYRSEAEGGEGSDGYFHLKAGVETHFRVSQNWLIVPALTYDHALGVNRFGLEDADLSSLNPGLYFRWSP